jgi:sodium/hydrogen antiporter
MADNEENFDRELFLYLIKYRHFMSEYPIFVFVAMLILAYGLFSRLAEKSIVTAPMVFVAVGIVTRYLTGNSVDVSINGSLVKILAELTLILVLFIDASTINLKELIRERRLPLRLLLIGLPMTMIAGALIAKAFYPDMDVWILVLMALILSPTDAALGQAVVTSKFVPEKIRQTINVESGLNDGIALPPILICIAALAEHNTHGSGFSYWSLFTLKQFIFGPLIGGLVGWLGGRLVERASQRGWMNTTFQRLASISLAVLAFSLAETVHGNGFIAAYFAGLFLGTTTHEIRERIHEFGEAESQALELVIFLLFGFILVPLTYHSWDWRAWSYALLSLTVIRMIPVAISLRGTKLPIGTVGFIGWFGPRGIASILYLLLVAIELGRDGLEQMMAVIVLTVLLSIFLHGISANPLSKMYQK